MTVSEFQEVYSAANAQDAFIIKAALLDAGIEARVVGDNLQNAVGDLTAAAITPSVLVRPEQLEQARMTVADQMARRQLHSSPASEWICPQCSESNDSSFEICWNCQHERT